MINEVKLSLNRKRTPYLSVFLSILILFLVFLESKANQIYSKYKSNNKKKYQNGPVQLLDFSAKDIKEAVEYLNNLRSSIATQTTKHKERLPAGINLCQMYYSKYLENTAKDWMTKLTNQHGCFVSRPSSHSNGEYRLDDNMLGEVVVSYYDLKIKNTNFPRPPNKLIDAINSWWNEIDNFITNNDTPDRVEMGKPKVSGHFQSMVVGTNHRIGCSMCTQDVGDKINYKILCHLHRDATRVGSMIYKRGQVGEKMCYTGWQGQSPYTGLCCPDGGNFCTKDSYMWPI